VVRVEDISPKDFMTTLSFDDLKILLDTLQGEIARIKSSVSSMSSTHKPPAEQVMATLRPWQLVQSVKAVCAVLGNLETLEAQEACDALVTACRATETGPSGSHTLTSVGGAADRVAEAVLRTVEVYAKTFRVNFSLSQADSDLSGGMNNKVNFLINTLLLQLPKSRRL